MRIPKLVIVADDLTGAADSAARCMQAGLSTEIWIEASSTGTDADVVALSTDSRFLLAAEAAQRVTETVVTMSSWTSATWYKKIDSTLRGNLGAELDAMLAAFPESVAVICPAFPAQGRGLEGGRLAYADFPPHHLPRLLQEQSQLPIGVVELATVRQGVNVLEDALRQRHEQGERLIVVDGLTDRDLEIIVAATQSGTYLLCGSAGLVAPLVARWAEQRAGHGKRNGVASGPILAVMGSGSAMAHAQVAQVAATEAMRVRAMDHSWYEVDLVGAQGHPVGDWLLCLDPPSENAQLEGAAARVQAARLADLAFAAVAKLEPSALLVVGGDTAYYVLRRLGIERLTVVEELLPGIALTFGVDRAGKRRAVVLKPGNFGDVQTLVTLHQAVRQRQF